MTPTAQTFVISTSSVQWLEYWRPGRRRALRMFCLPHAGGNAAMFRDWKNVLPPSLEVCPVQYPGRGTRFSEPLFTDLTALADAMTEGLSPLIEGAFVLCGHSMGALLAFEVARRFEARMGTSPNMLLVAGARPPHLRRDERRTHDLSDSQFRAELQKINGTPPAILDDPEAMELVMPIVRADFQAVETYQFKSGQRLRCPIHAFGGRKDQDVGEAHLDGWGEHTTGSFHRTMLDGDHFFVNDPGARFVDHIAQVLRPLLQI